MIVTEVKKLEPIALRKEWMNDLAQAVAFLESLNLAHGDLRPDNILLDRNRLKVSDFDWAAEIGTEFEACLPPYGRVLNDNEPDHGESGGSGMLGPRTEQFALGSLYYLINYGFEVYGDQCLTEDPYDHGPKVVELLQDMQFPALHGDKVIDDIISRCWHNGYGKVAELAAYTETLLYDKAECETTDTVVPNSRESNRHTKVYPHYSREDVSSKKAYCEDLKKRGLLSVLSQSEPEQIGLTLEWYRYTMGS